MLLRYSQLLLGIVLLGLGGLQPVIASTTVAFDNASTSAYAAETGGGWKGLNPTANENPPGSDNGGVGFTAWDFSGGFHYPTESPYGRLNHFVDGVDFPHSSFNNLAAPAFALTNSNLVRGGSTASARRPFNSPLNVGNMLSLRFNNPTLAPLHQQAPSGLIIRLNSGSGAQSVERFAIFAASDFNSGAWAASDAAGDISLGLLASATNQGAEFRFTLTGAETYQFDIRPLTGGAPLASRSGTLRPSTAGALRSLDVVMYENGSGNGTTGSAAQATGQREFFFDDLLITAPSVSGDYDGDADVDGADFLIWQRSLGSHTSLAADGNNNGEVDAADLQYWKQGFGTIPASATASPVPEPPAAALALAIFAASSTCARRQRRRMGGAT